MSDIRLATTAKAKEILGKNFHGPEQSNECLNCQLPENSGWIIPWDIKTLESYREDCFLFFGSAKDKQGEPITISWLKKMFPKKPGFMPNIGADHSLEKFHNQTTCQEKWYLIWKKIPDVWENNRIAQEHQSRKIVKETAKISSLKDNEKLESAVVYLYGLFLHYLTTREKLYHHDYILCDDFSDDGHPIRIGYFAYLQTYVGTSQPGMYYNILGLAPSIKPLV